MKICKFISKDGKKCNSAIVSEGGFCFAHSPDKKTKLKTVEKEKQILTEKFKLPKPYPMQQIRKNCLECCGGGSKTIKFCASVNCPLWYLRFGCFPKAHVRNNGEKYAQLFNKENFGRDKRYDPRMLVDEMKV